MPGSLTKFPAMEAFFKRAGFEIEDYKLVDPMNDSPNFVVDGFRRPLPVSEEAVHLIKIYLDEWVRLLVSLGVVVDVPDIIDVFRGWDLTNSAGPGLSKFFSDKGQAMLTYFIEGFEPSQVPIAYVKEEVIKMMKYLEGRFRIVHSVPGRNLLLMRCLLLNELESFKRAGLTKSGWDNRKDLPRHFQEWNNLVKQHGWTHIVGDVANCELSHSAELIEFHHEVVKRLGCEIPQELREFEVSTPFAASWKEDGVWKHDLVPRRGKTLSGIYTTGVSTTHSTTFICWLVAKLKGIACRVVNTSDDLDVLYEGSVSIEEFERMFNVFGFTLKDVKKVHDYRDYECMGATLRMTNHGLQPVWSFEKVLVRLLYVDRRRVALFDWCMRAAQSLSYVCFHERFNDFWTRVFVPIVGTLTHQQRSLVMTCFRSNVAAYNSIALHANPAEVGGGKLAMEGMKQSVEMLLRPDEENAHLFPDLNAKNAAVTFQTFNNSYAPVLAQAGKRSLTGILTNDPRFPLWISDSTPSTDQITIPDYTVHHSVRHEDGFLYPVDIRKQVDNFASGDPFLNASWKSEESAEFGIPLYGAIGNSGPGAAKYEECKLMLPAIPPGRNQASLPAGKNAQLRISAKITYAGFDSPASMTGIAALTFLATWQKDDGTAAASVGHLNWGDMDSQGNTFYTSDYVAAPNSSDNFRLEYVSIKSEDPGTGIHQLFFIDELIIDMRHGGAAPSQSTSPGGPFTCAGIFNPHGPPSLTAWRNEGAFIRTTANTLLLSDVSNVMQAGGLVTFVPYPEDVSIFAQAIIDPNFLRSRRGVNQYRETNGAFVAMCPDPENQWKPSFGAPCFDGNTVIVLIETPDTEVEMRLKNDLIVEVVTDSQTWPIRKNSPDMTFVHALHSECKGSVWILTSENPGHVQATIKFAKSFYNGLRKMLPMAGDVLSLIPHPAAQVAGRVAHMASAVDDAVSASQAAAKPGKKKKESKIAISEKAKKASKKGAK